jgi:hypothetical protein
LPITVSMPASTRTEARRWPDVDYPCCGAWPRNTFCPMALPYVRGPRMGPTGSAQAVTGIRRHENRLVKAVSVLARPKGFEPLTF